MSTPTSSLAHYVNPTTLEALTFEGNLELGDGFLISASGGRFPVGRGIPNFVETAELKDEDWESLAWYRENASTYDDFLPLTFRTLKVDESTEREKIIDELRLGPGLRVLETGCGSGRDSLRIAKEIGSGELFLQDISEEILKVAIEKFSQIQPDPSVYFALANGYSLPFADNFFDRTFHFGGLNTFGDKRKALSEMARVTKPGGRVVVGDESLPPWLRASEFGKILMNSNPHFAHQVPLGAVPECARNFKLQYIIGDAFYLMSFEKASGDPEGDFDFEIPGWRGGTHRNRYFGQLEGVSPELKREVTDRAKAEGTSVAVWLQRALRQVLDSEI